MSTQRNTCPCLEKNKALESKGSSIRHSCPICRDPNDNQGWNDFICDLEEDLVADFLTEKLFTSLGLESKSYEEWAEAVIPLLQAYSRGDEMVRAEFNTWFK